MAGTTPGWFPDPQNPSRQRYFDGTGWTDRYAPFSAAAPPPAQPVKTGMSSGMKAAIGIGAVVLALGVIASVGDDNKTSSTSWSKTSIQNRPVSVSPTTTKSGFTPAQDNAIDKAETYLDYSAFSKQGLITQLEYDQFSTADATFAVEQLETKRGVDWNEQAAKKAKTYLEYTSFSLLGLVDQLSYDGFTPAQAEYGATTAYGG